MNTIFLEFLIASKQYSILLSYWEALSPDSVVHYYLRKKSKIRHLSPSGIALSFPEVIREVEDIMIREDITSSFLFYTRRPLETINERIINAGNRLIPTPYGQSCRLTYIDMNSIRHHLISTIKEALELRDYALANGFHNIMEIDYTLFKDCDGYAFSLLPNALQAKIQAIRM
jgi:hypothetical protein